MSSDRNQCAFQHFANAKVRSDWYCSGNSSGVLSLTATKYYSQSSLGGRQIELEKNRLITFMQAISLSFRKLNYQACLYRSINIINRKKKFNLTYMEHQQNICTCNPNIYNELKLREMEYVQLIKDLYDENQRLKAELVSLREEVLMSINWGCMSGSGQGEQKWKKQASNGHSNSNITMNQINDITNNNYLTLQTATKQHHRTPSFNTPSNSSTELIASDTAKNYTSGSLFSFVDSKEVVQPPPPSNINTTTPNNEDKDIIRIPTETRFNKIFANLLKSQPNIQIDELFPRTTTEIQLNDNHMENSAKTNKENPWRIKTNKSIVKDQSRTSVKFDGYGDDGISEYSQLCEFRYGTQLKSLINRDSQAQIKVASLTKLHQEDPQSKHIRGIAGQPENHKHVSFSPSPSNIISYTVRKDQAHQDKNLPRLRTIKNPNTEKPLARHRQTINNKVYL